MCTHMLSHAHTRSLTYMCTYGLSRMHTFIHTCTHARVYMHVRTHMLVHTCTHTLTEPPAVEAAGLLAPRLPSCLAHLAIARLKYLSPENSSDC